MKKFHYLWILLLFLGLVGCNFSPNEAKDEFKLQTSIQVQHIFHNKHEEQGKGKFIIDSIEDVTQKPIKSRSISARGSDDTFELWLMPAKRSKEFAEPIMHENVSLVKYFSISNEGTFEIPLSDFPRNDPSVVFIVRTTDKNNIEVVGFLSLMIDDSHSIIEFPPAKEMTGDISFGAVYFSEDSYIATSELNLEDNKESFTNLSLQSLQEDTLENNLALMSLNILGNTTEDVYYAPMISLEYDISNTENWGYVTLMIISNDYTSNAALYTPNERSLLPQNAYRYGPGKKSSVQWSRSMSIPDFLDSAKKGALWVLRDEQGNKLASFDFSVALILDENKNPIVPCIEPSYTMKDDNPSFVDSISFNWFYINPDGKTKKLITDENEIASFVQKDSLFMDLQFGKDFPDIKGVTYQYRDYFGGRSYGMRGSLLQATDFNAPLKVEDLKYLSIGYRFTFYNCWTPWRPKPQL